MQPSNPVTTVPDLNAVQNVPQTAVGPGAIPQTAEQQPSLLDGVDSNEWVDLFNPLSVTFQAQIASSRPANIPVKVYQTPNLQSGIRTEGDLATQYGLTGFKNPNHPSNVHVPHIVEIASGQTRRFPGNEAQVVLRQLVGYVLQVEGKGLKLADPFERGNMEQRLIRGRGSMEDLMSSTPMSVQDQVKASIDQYNAGKAPGHVPTVTTIQEPEFADAAGANTPGQLANGDSNLPKA